MEKPNDSYEIDLMQICRALLRNVWWLVLAAVILGALAFSYAAFVVTPLYTSEALVFVNNSSFSLGNTSFSISAAEISAAKSLVSTYIVILNTRSTLNEVARRTGLDYSYDQLKGMISASAVNSTEVFSIKVTSSSPQEAELLANTIAEVLPDKIADIVDGSSMRIVDYAVVPTQKTSPSISKYTAVGVLLGVVAACAVVIVKEMMDTQIHNDDYLISTYKLPILAMIPDLFSSGNAGYYTAYEATFGTVKE